MRVGERYGRLDRLLHDVAFRAGRAQRALADVEELFHGDRLAEIPLERPVFLTGLPRSGTSLLLRLLHGSGRFATHTYRDVPFVLCPMLWRRFSARFAADAPPVERAHGDGLEVSADTPEAFEEMIWKEFWPGHYLSDRILPWTSPAPNAEFASFLEAHMRKVIALRREDPSDRRRYLSKNNVNVARLAGLPGPLREGVFLVPFREPVQQAASMLAQHRRFTEIHDADDFVRRYMEGVGHHEFGRGLRPVDFGGWLETAPAPESLEFWLRYWIAAYRHVLEHAGDAARLVPYDRLTREPADELARVARAVDVPEAALTALSGSVRPPREHEAELAGVAGGVVEETRRVHDELQRRAAA